MVRFHARFSQCGLQSVCQQQIKSISFLIVISFLILYILFIIYEIFFCYYTWLASRIYGGGINGRVVRIVVYQLRKLPGRGADIELEVHNILMNWNQFQVDMNMNRAGQLIFQSNNEESDYILATFLWVDLYWIRNTI